MDYQVKEPYTSSKGEKKKIKGSCIECLSVQNAVSATNAFTKEHLLLSETKHNRPLYFIGYIKEMSVHRVQINLGFALNLISASAIEELGISPSKLSHTFVSIFEYHGSTQRPIGKSDSSFRSVNLSLKLLHASTSFSDAPRYMRMVSSLQLYINASSLLATTT